MTNATNKPISSRAQRALEILENGGSFVHRLEDNRYTGRAQFQWRLISNGHCIKGIGMATYYELQGAGVQFRMAPSNSVATYWKLAQKMEIAA